MQCENVRMHYRGRASSDGGETELRRAKSNRHLRDSPRLAIKGIDKPDLNSSWLEPQRLIINSVVKNRRQVIND